MPYRDPKTKVLYPTKKWMFEHWATLPEVQKAYPGYKKPTPVKEPSVPAKPKPDVQPPKAKGPSPGAVKPGAPPVEMPPGSAGAILMKKQQGIPLTKQEKLLDVQQQFGALSKSFGETLGREDVQKSLAPVLPVKQIAPVVSTKELDVAGTPLPDLGVPEAPATISTYTTGLLADLGKKRKALDDLYTKQIKDLQTQKTALETKISDITTTQKGMLEKDIKPLLEPFRADLEKSERERLKLEENYFANQRSVQELETLLTQAMTEIDAAKEVTGLAAIRSPRIAKLQRDMAARVGVIEAVMAARNNQITVAENLIDRSVSAIEADRKDQLTYYNALYSFYETQKDEKGKKLVTLTQDEKGFLEAQIGLLESDLATSQASVDHIKGLLLDPETAGLAESAGITLTDTIEQVNTKLASAIYQRERQDKVSEMALDDFKFMALPAQYAGKPEAELTRIYDSKGKEMVFWKKPEVKAVTQPTSYREWQLAGKPGTYEDWVKGKGELLSVAEAKALGVPYGTTRAGAKGITAPTEPTRADNWKRAKQFITDNPDASYEELEVALRENTEFLTDADFKSLLTEAGKTKGEVMGTIEDFEIKISDFVKGVKDFGYDRDEAKDYIMGGVIKDYGGGDIKGVPESVKGAIEGALVKIYGESKGFWRKFWDVVKPEWKLPGGK